MDNEKKYLDIIYLKTGKLFEASALVAAELAGAEHLDTASSFGKNFGIAYNLIVSRPDSQKPKKTDLPYPAFDHYADICEYLNDGISE